MDVIAEWAEKCFRRRSRGVSMSKGAYEQTSLLHIDEPFEEESVRGYKPKNFYPVQVGQHLNARYKVLGKLGYDASGTSWFCHDKKAKRHVEVKVCIALPANGSKKCRSNSEWNAYTHMSGMVTENTGFSYLRQILDRFTVVSHIGAEHQCFVYVPAGLDLAEFQRLAPNADMKLLKDILRAMLQALDFLHQDARIMHTDFKPETILFTVTQKTTLELFAKKLQARQPVGKRDPTDPTRIIYQTVRFTHLLQLHELSLGKPVLGDLGGCRIVHQNDDLLLPRDMAPDASRSPEMALGLCWTFATDIWSCAVVTWLLFARSPLFSAYDARGQWDADAHLAAITALLGSAPPGFAWTGPGAAAAGEGKEGERDREKRVSVGSLNVDATFADWDLDQRTEFMEFMHAMLKWRAEERCSASELLDLAFLDQAGSPYE